MADATLPAILYRVVVTGPDAYLRPRSKTFANSAHANNHADKAEAQGLRVEIYEARPDWSKIYG